MADRVEDARPYPRHELVVIRGDDFVEGSTGDPGPDIGPIRRARPIVDRADHVVIAMPAEMIPEGVRPARVPGHLDPEPDRHAAWPPALGGLADDALAIRIRHVAPGRVAPVEVDVVGDRDLGQALLDRQRSVDIDRDPRVERERRGRPGGRGRHPEIRPSSWPTRSKADTARSRCSSVSAAVTIVRRRAWSRATVGYTTEVAKMPSSNSRPERRIAASESPTMTGVIGVSERPVSNPRRASSALNRFVLAHSRSMSHGSSSMTRIASRHAAATAGGWEVENRNGRARWIRRSRRFREPAT